MNEQLIARAWFDVWVLAVEFVGFARSKNGMGPTIARSCVGGAAEARHGSAGATKAVEIFDNLLAGAAAISSGKTP